MRRSRSPAFFHAPKVQTPDWEALRRVYLPLLDRTETREELNSVLGEMIGEVSVGHAYMANSGDVPQPPANPTGMLGADYALENGAYRITRIYEAAPWDDTVRSPLAGVREGEYLLAVDGVPLDTSRDPRAAFVADKGRGGLPVSLELSCVPLKDPRVLPRIHFVQEVVHAGEDRLAVGL